MDLRDRLESALWAWHSYELARKRAPIIDYDTHPERFSPEPASDRMAVHTQLVSIRDEARASNRSDIAARADAELAYLRAVLGERAPISSYIQLTQGCAAAGWAPEYVLRVQETARSLLDNVGIPWGSETRKSLEAREGHVDPHNAAQRIREASVEFEPTVRALTGAEGEYALEAITVNEDVYWSYWLDTVGQAARLRINSRNARFTEVTVRQFALHEVLGHAMQSASYAAQAASSDVPWVRYFTVHGPHQVMFEGLAQAMPLFVARDDDALLMRLSLDHYCQLVMSELHLAINAGLRASECVAHARSRVPFWSDEQIADLLTERSVNPQLRSYLWAYPAGIDWFVALGSADEDVIRKVLHAAYRAPLSPTELHHQWPAGPPIGGAAEAFCLR